MAQQSNEWVEYRYKVSIRGQVTDGSDVPISGAQVTITHGLPVPKQTFTDQNGHYCFMNLPAATYTITASWAKSKFDEPCESSNDNVTVSDDDPNEPVDFELTLPSGNVEEGTNQEATTAY